ncbi:MAG: hypothetical protein FWF15_07425 [Oscillospiraceae bacterium]|nr:hypothetical protein [Oscillospiraceae bacterium]
MTNRERLLRTCTCRPADRAPFHFYFGPWGETLARWQKEGLGEGNTDWASSFPFDPQCFYVLPVNLGIFPAFEYKLIEQRATTAIIQDSQGVIQEILTLGPTIPKYLEFPVKDLESWKKFKAERLNPDLPERFPANWKEVCGKLKNFDGLVQIGSYPYGIFGTTRELIGLENLMFALYDEPEFVHAVMDDLTSFWLTLYEKAANEVHIDVIHIWEDMSGRQGSLISPAMMYEFMVPNYNRIKKFADERGIPVIVLDTDGNVSEMIQVFMDGGINMLMPFEFTDGNDIVQFRRDFPNLAMLGGISKVAVSRGREAIDAELARIKPLFDYPGYFPALDHLIHPGISWDDFSYFCEKLHELILKKM